MELWTPPSADRGVLLEERAPTVATVTGPFGTSRALSTITYSDEAAYQQHYFGNLYVWRCVQTIARDAARCPVIVGRPGRTGEVTTHDPALPLAQLLGPAPGGPTPEMSARQWWATYVTQRLILGAFGCEVELDGRSIVALWPLQTSKLRPVLADGGTRYFSGYKYLVGGHDRDLRTEQVFYSWNPRPDDVRFPQSVLEAARLDVDVSTMIAAYESAFLRNDARPATMVVHRAFQTAGQKRAWRSDFLGDHRGPERAGSVHFMETTGDPTEALHVAQLGATAKDSQLSETAIRKRSDVCIAFGVPLSRLGDASGRTYANADEEAEAYGEQTIEPLLAELDDDVNLRLAPRLGNAIIRHDVEQLPHRRKAAERARLTIAVDEATKAAATPPPPPPPAEETDEEDDDSRAAPEAPQPDPEPDAPTPPLVPVPRAVRAAAERALGAGVDAPEHLRVIARALSSGQVPVGVAEAVARHHANLPPGKGSAFAGGAAGRRWSAPYAPPVDTREETAAERRAKTWRRVDAAARGVERTWERALRRLFAAQEEATLARLKGKRGTQALRAAGALPEGWSRTQTDTPLIPTRAEVSLSSLFDPIYWQEATTEEARALYEAAVASGVTRIADQLGVAFDLEAAYVAEVIAERAQRLGQLLTTTTGHALSATLSEGTIAGESIDQLAARIRVVFTDATDRRARLIARTEVIGSSNEGAQRFAASLGAEIAAGKEWITSVDGRERRTHREADGQVVEISGRFLVGSAMMDHPGDTDAPSRETVQCVIEGTEVQWRDDLEAIFRRPYSGEAVKLSTADGHSLTVTPNHPVLTLRGWVPAHLLQGGDELVTASAIESGNGPEVQHRPPPVEEVYGAARKTWHVGRVTAAAVDFHGDGLSNESQVEVVSADVELRDDGVSVTAEQLLHAELIGLTHAQSPTTRDGSRSVSSAWSAETRPGLPSRIVGGFRERPSLGDAEPSHAEPVGLGGRSDGQAELDETPTDQPPRDAEAPSDGEHAQPVTVETTKLTEVQVLPFHGYVYNLSTPGQWYSANGIVLHNCRCAIAFLSPEEMDARRSAGARVIDLATARAMIAVWDPSSDEGAQRFAAQVQAISREVVPA